MSERGGAVRLDIAIQHHPSRPHLPERLLTMLGDLPDGAVWRVVSDPDPTGPASPWRTQQAAWASSPDWATHTLLLQDDVLPAPGALRVVTAAIEARPAAVVAYYLGWMLEGAVREHRLAAGAGGHWAPIPRPTLYLPCLAISMPRALALDVAPFEAPQYAGRVHVADDEVLGTWYNARAGVEAYTIVPSVFQHDDEQPSTLLGHRDGRRRIANCWIGDWPADELAARLRAR